MRLGEGSHYFVTECFRRRDPRVQRSVVEMRQTSGWRPFRGEKALRGRSTAKTCGHSCTYHHFAVGGKPKLDGPSTLTRENDNCDGMAGQSLAQSTRLYLVFAATVLRTIACTGCKRGHRGAPYPFDNSHRNCATLRMSHRRPLPTRSRRCRPELILPQHSS
jgi:hypothetical protein